MQMQIVRLLPQQMPKVKPIARLMSMSMALLLHGPWSWAVVPLSTMLLCASAG